MLRALSFLTPFGRAVRPGPAALDWFPAVGALIGLGVGCCWWAGRQLWSPAGAAAAAVLADAVLTGLLHLDGLADSADGLLPPLPRERRLEVMADPRLGAFGVAGLVTVLLARFSAFASMPPSVLAVAGLWCGSRTAMALTVLTVPYARPGGLASAFLATPGDAAQGEHAQGDGAPGRRAVDVFLRPVVIGLVGGLMTFGLAVAGRGVHGMAASAAALAGAGAVVVLAWRRLGGFTGDVLGAAAVTGETIGLLVLAARW